MNRGIPTGRSSKPLYQVVEDHIRQLIDSGELVPGDLIPSEPQLARQLNVSPGTAKKAIDKPKIANKVFEIERELLVKRRPTA